jgi:hypothetical protein
MTVFVTEDAKKWYTRNGDEKSRCRHNRSICQKTTAKGAAMDANKENDRE